METVALGFAASVFGAGLLSFFTPCVLPLVPVYVSYLSTDTHLGTSPLPRRILQALAFVTGLSVVFFLLGFGAGALGGILTTSYFYIACGVIVLLFGLYHSGLIEIPLLNRERRFALPPNANRNTILGALLMGLIFSFGWTPCVGPILGSVLAVTSQQGSALIGGLLLMVYALGLGVPFIVITLGSEILVTRLKNLQKYLPTLKLIGGLIIASLGLFMIFSQVYSLENNKSDSVSESAGQSLQRTATGPDFTLQSMEGTTVSLSDYQGKPVYIKFWATWCPVCLAGLEDFSAIAADYNEAGDIVVLSIIAPGMKGEMTGENFTKWARSQELGFPILFDEGAVVNQQFEIQAYPSSLFIDANGNVVETHIGAMDTDELREKLDAMTSR